MVELSSGQTESVMLTNDPSLPAPMLRHKEGIIVLNGMPYSTSEVKGMRLEKRMVDAIRTVDNSQLTDGNLVIYDLSGRKVSVSSVSSVSSELPKGIYIVNGRKVVVR